MGEVLESASTDGTDFVLPSIDAQFWLAGLYKSRTCKCGVRTLPSWRGANRINQDRLIGHCGDGCVRGARIVRDTSIAPSRGRSETQQKAQFTVTTGTNARTFARPCAASYSAAQRQPRVLGSPHRGCPRLPRRYSPSSGSATSGQTFQGCTARRPRPARR